MRARRRAWLAVVLVLVIAVFGMAWYSAAFGNWPWQGEPERISYCSRDYAKVDGPPTVVGDIGFIGDPPFDSGAFRVPPLIGRKVIPAPSDCDARRGPFKLFRATGEGDYREYRAR